MFLAALHALVCKGSTGFVESLSPREIGSLLAQWSACEFKEICPISKRVSLPDLLREFGRI